jgi:hypothetical protein
MRVKLEKMVEVGIISEEFCQEMKDKGIQEMAISPEALQDATFRKMHMSVPLTGPISKEEADDWMTLFAYFTNEHINDIREKVNPTFEPSDFYQDFYVIDDNFGSLSG